MDIQKINMPADANIKAYSIKNIPAKKPAAPGYADASDKTGDAKPEKVRRRPENKEVHQESSGKQELPERLKIAFSIEDTLNIMVARVIDENTLEVLRQVPAEEIIEKKKLLKIYSQLTTVKGLLLDYIRNPPLTPPKRGLHVFPFREEL